MPVSLDVVIPLYNKRRHIGRAIDSVLRQKAQNFELIVVDDGSTDGGQEVPLSYLEQRIRLVTQSNQGPAAARNAGIAASSADYIAFLDADDEWHPGFLEEIVRLVSISPASAVFSTAYDIVKSTGAARRSSAEYVADRRLLAGNRLKYLECVAQDMYPFSSSSVCVKKSYFDEVGLFDIKLRIGEDTDMWLRLSFVSDVLFSPTIGATYFRDADNRAPNQPDVCVKQISYVNNLVCHLRTASLSKAQHDAFRRFVSYKIYRCCRGLLNAGFVVEARQLVDGPDEVILPWHATKFLFWEAQSLLKARL